MNGDSRHSVEQFFDDLGEGEWARFDADLRSRTAFEIHRRFLARFVTSGMSVLEIGAGPGRFTIELVRLGAAVHVSDLSQVQLDLNKRYVGAAGCEHGVVARDLLDICDLSAIENDRYDAAVAYGGPLSYAFDQAPTALREILRVTRAGGPVLASVMTIAGNARFFLSSFRPLIDTLGLNMFDEFLRSGDQRLIAEPGEHACQLFSWSDVRELVEHAGAEIVAASASNWLSLQAPEVVQTLADPPELWAQFLDWEESLCTEPGALDVGTHLLVAARKR